MKEKREGEEEEKREGKKSMSSGAGSSRFRVFRFSYLPVGRLTRRQRPVVGEYRGTHRAWCLHFRAS